MNGLIIFWASECPHCKRMMPLAERLEKEMGIQFEKLEVWHNEENVELMRSYRKIIAPKCGGQLRTPTFLNPETGDVLCGEVEYEKLKQWIEK